MPIYEYECRDCGHHMEAIQKFSDAPLSDCPKCGKSALHKMLSAPSFRLKGGGWYETDFKTGNRRHGTQSEPAASDAAKPAKTENLPAA